MNHKINDIEYERSKSDILFEMVSQGYELIDSISEWERKYKAFLKKHLQSFSLEELKVVANCPISFPVAGEGRYKYLYGAFPKDIYIWIITEKVEIFLSESEGLTIAIKGKKIAKAFFDNDKSKYYWNSAMSIASQKRAAFSFLVELYFARNKEYCYI